MKRILSLTGLVAILLFCTTPARAYESSPTGWASYNTIANPDPCFSPNLNGTTGGAGGQTATVSDEVTLETVLRGSLALPGPCLVVAKVEESAPAAKPPCDCVFIKQRFMAALGVPEAGTEGMRSQ